jgi:hypothetical protein
MHKPQQYLTSIPHCAAVSKIHIPGFCRMVVKHSRASIGTTELKGCHVQTNRQRQRCTLDMDARIDQERGLLRNPCRKSLQHSSAPSISFSCNFDAAAALLERHADDCCELEEATGAREPPSTAMDTTIAATPSTSHQPSSKSTHASLSVS